MSKAITDMISGFQTFQETYFKEHPELFKTLTEVGQSPKTLVIACSDSRVDPAILFNTEPGDLFVIRNVANLVPPYQPDGGHHSTSAALEFATRDLKVQNVVILGHSQCGGIHALVDSHCHDNPMERDFICSWVSIADDAVTDPASEPYGAETEQGAIKVSLNNLMTYPWVRERVEAKNLELHGWWFDIGEGALWGWNADKDAFAKF